MTLPKVTSTRIISILGILIVGWLLFYSPKRVAPATAVWSLSPEKDKLVYQTQHRTVVNNLLTDEQLTVTDCIGRAHWLDNNRLVCNNLLIDANNQQITPIKLVTPSQVDLEYFQKIGGVAYTDPKYGNISVILANYYQSSPNNNYLIYGYGELDQKQSYEELVELFITSSNLITMPERSSYFMRDGQSVYSPDGTYYFQTRGPGLLVSDANTHRIVRSYWSWASIFPPGGFLLGARSCYYDASWEAASRAIYFQIECASGGFFNLSQDGKTSLYRLQVR